MVANVMTICVLASHTHKSSTHSSRRRALPPSGRRCRVGAEMRACQQASYGGTDTTTAPASSRCSLGARAPRAPSLPRSVGCKQVSVCVGGHRSEHRVEACGDNTAGKSRGRRLEASSKPSKGGRLVQLGGRMVGSAVGINSGTAEPQPPM
jgi:hypothetical protein